MKTNSKDPRQLIQGFAMGQDVPYKTENSSPQIALSAKSLDFLAFSIAINLKRRLPLEWGLFVRGIG